MDSSHCTAADKQEPRETGMRGLRDGALHIEAEYRLGGASPSLSQSHPARIAGTGRPLSSVALTDKIHVYMILIGRPMPVEVVEEGRPVERQSVPLEILHREGEAVIDADQRPLRIGKPFDQPFADTPSCPILARARRWRHFCRRSGSICEIDAQTLQARRWSFSTGIVNADIAIEDWAMNGGRQLQLPFESLVEDGGQECGEFGGGLGLEFLY